VRERRWPLLVLLTPATAVAGVVLVVIAFAVKTTMGSGSGHRYVPLDILQLAGSALILLSALPSVFRLDKNTGTTG